MVRGNRVQNLQHHGLKEQSTMNITLYQSGYSYQVCSFVSQRLTESRHHRAAWIRLSFSRNTRFAKTTNRWNHQRLFISVENYQFLIQHKAYKLICKQRKALQFSFEGNLRFSATPLQNTGSWFFPFASPFTIPSRII